MIDSPMQTQDTDEGLHEQSQAAPAPPGLDFHLLLEAMPAAAYSTDAEGLITYFNRRAVQAWGREPRLHDPLDRY